MDRYSTFTRELRAACPALDIREHESMAEHTAFRVGGPARVMVLPRSEEEALQAVKTATGLGIVPFFMGNGSNLLVADGGYDGLVLKAVEGLGALERQGDTLYAGSGVLLPKLASFACEQGLTGLEFAHGIPGSVGGAVTMNAGAYGGEMAQVVEEVHLLTPQGEREILRGAALEFGYRHSAFSGGERLILGAKFRLTGGDREKIRARMEELMAERRRKQPLEWPSAGSTFKRPAPVDGKAQYAAALIDRCGLKGRQVGGAQVSEKHAGFIVNRGGATCHDILALVDVVRETVLRAAGVTLELEVRTLGG